MNKLQYITHNACDMTLTHWDRDNMVAILQITYAHSFFAMKIVVFWFNTHQSMAQLTTIKNNDNIGPDSGVGSNRRQVIIWTKNSLVYWSIYASIDRNKLMYQYSVT